MLFVLVLINIFIWTGIDRERRTFHKEMLEKLDRMLKKAEAASRREY